MSKCFLSPVRAARTLQRLVLPLVILLASCMARGPRTQPVTDQSVIHAEELEGTRQNTLYEAVRIARPMWFNSRSGGESAILVYQDDQAVGGVGVLRRISVFSTARVTYMAPTEAQIRFGQRNGMRAAIVVESLR